jgi:hypothetical protein
MAMTKEELKAQIAAEIRTATAAKRARAQRPKPKLVVDQDRVVGAAAVHLSPADPNWRGSGSEYVIINERLALVQRAEREAYQRYLRELDPCGLGLYGAD